MLYVPDMRKERRHGTVGRYRYGSGLEPPCRCVECRAANAQRQREYMEGLGVQRRSEVRSVGGRRVSLQEMIDSIQGRDPDGVEREPFDG